MIYSIMTSFSVMTVCSDWNAVRWTKGVMKIWVIANTCLPHFWFSDLCPNSLRMTQDQFPTQPCQPCDLPWPISLRMVNCCWMGTLLADFEKRMQAVKTKCLRKFLCISYLEHKTNDCIWSKIVFLLGPQESLSRWSLMAGLFQGSL